MKKLYAVLIVTGLMFMAACTSNSAEDANNKQDVAKAEKKEAYNLKNDGIDKAAFKKALSDFPKEVSERVITTSVPLAEMMDLLNVTPVGVPTSTNPLPKKFDSIEKIGSPMSPDLEKVVDLKPDLLLGSEALRSTLDKSVEGMDLQTAYLPTDSYDDLKLSFKTLGTYFNKNEEMNNVFSSLLKKENELAAKSKGKKMPSVMLMIGTSDSFMVMSEASYLGSLVKKLGADNIATSTLKVKETYSPLNMENVVAADPDMIFVLASGDHGASKDMFQKEVKKNDAWTKLSAYKNDNIHTLDYETYGVTSIKHAEKSLTEIANYFYK